MRRFPALLLALLLPLGAEAADLKVTPANVNAEALKPGLLASYWYAAFEHIKQLEKAMQEKQGWTPNPIAALDQCAGDGKMYEAGVIENYGIHGRGYLRFPAAGDWQVAVRSNDGIRLKLDGQVAVEDPEVHGNRLSKPVKVTVPAPGLVPIDFIYFQKKGGACLELQWQGPGEAALTLVPAAAYLHQPR